ncbi:Ectoine/hydroxyectoine transporter [Frankliniella fusca]|uniref:Ectoine/hydroxyectoine transporter n=1 Tax=Frankliniella fusca TaxID=407009 RepID=A0AAE1LII5_9NEOP|nr:Ectoine/hydroxyectoine transporter [Frankliniella fusca]
MQVFANSPQFAKFSKAGPNFFYFIVNFIGDPAPAADAEVAGCLFHFGQAHWRHFQGAGLAVTYRKEGNEAMRTDFHALIALAFIPVDGVEDSFDVLADVSVLALQPILKLLEVNYIRGRLRARRGGRVRRRTAPLLFPPELWNCYERTLAGLPRTTNTCEAWHKLLSSLVGKHHPSFFVFPVQLRYRKWRRSTSDYVVTYLRAIGHNLSGYF